MYLQLYLNKLSAEKKTINNFIYTKWKIFEQEII